ncbi:MAG: hypothetical protein AAFO07_13150 [Bacteroidota bacterium]
MKSFPFACLLLFLLFSCEKEQESPQPLEFTFDFDQSTEGWSGDFADYPLGEEVFYELQFGHSVLPQPLDQNQKSLKLSGSNRSDDLFMFLKKEITGLEPNQSYEVRIDIELASDAPTNAVGIGGPPAESVYLKTGISLIEPSKRLDFGYYLMNIDKGNQSQSGQDMEVIGHVGVADNTTEFTLINRSNASAPFSFQTDDTGKAWICIGTDSGFEGITTLYYNRIDIEFKQVN